MAQNSQNWPKLVPQKSPKTGKNGPRGPNGQKQWYLSSQNSFRNQWAEISEAQESKLKIGYFKIWISRLFFQKIFSKKLNLKPIFYNESIKFGKNLICDFNILHGKWHILKENHETKMSKITHSVQGPGGSLLTRILELFQF